MKKGVIWGSVIAGAVILMSCAGLAVWYGHRHPMVILGEDTDSPTVSQIENYGRFRLPPSAKEVKGRLEGFQDHILWARFTMDPADEGVFWASSPCATSADVESASAKGYAEIASDLKLIGSGPVWWDPLPKASFTARRAMPTSHLQVIVIDKSVPQKFTVYVLYGET